MAKMIKVEVSGNGTNSHSLALNAFGGFSVEVPNDPMAWLGVILVYSPKEWSGL